MPAGTASGKQASVTTEAAITAGAVWSATSARRSRRPWWSSRAARPSQFRHADARRPPRSSAGPTSWATWSCAIGPGCCGQRAAARGPLRARAASSAHQVLAWAEQHDSPYLLARAHRVLSIFYRQIGDLSEALTHAVQCVAQPDRRRAAGGPRPAPDDRWPWRWTRAARRARATAGSARRSRIATADRRPRADAQHPEQHGVHRLRERRRAGRPRPGRADARGAGAQRAATFGANELDTIARVEMMSGGYAAVEETLHAVLQTGRTSAVAQPRGRRLGRVPAHPGRGAPARRPATTPPRRPWTPRSRMAEERALHAVTRPGPRGAGRPVRRDRPVPARRTTSTAPSTPRRPPCTRRSGSRAPGRCRPSSRPPRRAGPASTSARWPTGTR